MHHRRDFIGWLIVAMLFAGPLALSGADLELQRPQAVAQMEICLTRIDWSPRVEGYERLILTVAGPGDFYIRQEFGPGQAPYLDIVGTRGNPLPDGIYAYELRTVPRLEREVREALARFRDTGNDLAIEDLRKKGQSLERSLVQSGYLSVREGRFVNRDSIRESPSGQVKPTPRPSPQSIGTKVITNAWECIGTACAAGDDNVPVLKLKGGVVRIKFEDVFDNFSHDRDWALQANDSASGSERFFLWDVDAQTTPFSVEGGAPDYSLQVGSNGNVGLGTSTPAVRLDVKGNASGAATERLQNSSATGYSGTEYLDNAGNLDLFFGIDNAASTTRLNSVNNNPIVILTNSTERIRFPAPGGNFITAANGAVLTAGGTWQNASSRETKSDIVELSDSDALKALQELTPVTFRYKAEPDEQYVGFIAEDVPDLVATNDHKHMSSMDVVAVLTKVVQDQQKMIEEMSARLAELEGKEK